MKVGLREEMTYWDGLADLLGRRARGGANIGPREGGSKPGRVNRASKGSE